MKKLEVAKTVVSLVVSIGVGAIVGNLIKSTTPEDVKKITKICITAGSFVLTGLASDMAGTYTEKTIDETVNAFKNVIKGKENSEEAVEEET